MSYMKHISFVISILLFVGCGEESLEVSHNNPIKLYEFDVPPISSEPGEYEINFEFPKSEVLITSGKPENIWRQNGNTLTLDLDVARDNSIEKAQFYIQIKKGAEEGEYPIVTPKISAKIDGVDYGKLDLKLNKENKAAFEKKIIYAVPMDPLLFWGIIIGVLLLLVVIIYLILRKLEIIGPVALSGRITFNDPADIPQVSLNKENDEFNLASHMGLADLDISLKPKKLKHRGKNRKFVRLYYMSSSDASISVKVENMGESRGAPSGEKLFNQDNIQIIVNQDGEIKTFDITYYNPKIRKI